MKRKDLIGKLKEKGTEFHSLILKTIETQEEIIYEAIKIIEKSLKKGGKLLIFGNGGSAADAMHIAGEFSGSAIALTSNISSLTAISNDRGFQFVFSAQIETLGRKKDVAWGLTTSGRSVNILEGLRKAKSLGLYTICMCGKYTELVKFCDVVVSVPSSNTQRIQEAHLFLGHIIWETLKESLS